MTRKDLTPGSIDLRLDSYHYDLPQELIAQRPIDQEGQKRDQSRLLVYDAKNDLVTHDYFYNLSHYLPVDSTLVFNQSKVFPSRIFGEKKSGGKCEVFLLSIDPLSHNIFPCLIKSRGKKKVGDEYFFPEKTKATIVKVLTDGTFEIELFLSEKFTSLNHYLEEYARIPIPPYIRKGESDELDKKSYQTIYSKNVGSVAAPTAGLHFTQRVFDELEKKKIDRAFVTLHVGLGTFKPVTAMDLSEHVMHSEDYFIDEENMSKIKKAKKTFAVGTTSLRVLESIYGTEKKADHVYQTQIFLHPGMDIKSIDGLITNFHLPESTLLMLVSSLIGRQKTLELYKIAVHEKYRFFSYGDAMLILR